MLRITSLELEHFKNTDYGKVRLSSWKQGDSSLSADIVGIYGQNGSGKTSVIQALAIAKMLFLGLELSECAQDCTSKNHESMEMTIEGTIFDNEQKILGPFKYKAEISERTDKIAVTAESLAFKNCEDAKPAMRNLFAYSSTDNGISFSPKIAWESLISLSTDVRTDFAVAQRISRANSKSFLFSAEFTAFLRTLLDAYEFANNERKLSKRASEAVKNYMGPLIKILGLIKNFALSDFAVVSSARHASSMLNNLKISTHEGGLGELADVSFNVNIASPCVLPEDNFQLLEKTIANINPVLRALVPELDLGVSPLERVMLDDGTTGVRAEITCSRNGVTVPFRCESEGIKKLVAILTLLIDVYAKPGACVAIDELDSGIFEFLLGEILQVLQEHGRGQLVFTAHNLRPLEIVDKGSLIFTTTNPRNRYVGFKGSRESNNLRSQYLRAVNLGGQPETVYAPTSKFDIDGAFFDAAFPAE